MNCAVPIKISKWSAKNSRLPIINATVTRDGVNYTRFNYNYNCIYIPSASYNYNDSSLDSIVFTYLQPVTITMTLVWIQLQWQLQLLFINYNYFVMGIKATNSKLKMLIYLLLQMDSSLYSSILEATYTGSPEGENYILNTFRVTLLFY